MFDHLPHFFVSLVISLYVSFPGAFDAAYVIVQFNYDHQNPIYFIHHPPICIIGLFGVLKNTHTYSDESGQQIKTVAPENVASDNSEDLNEKIKSLNRELLEEKQTRGAAEEALKHVQTLYLEADTKVQELSVKVAEVQHKMDQEIKERDEKYSELDSKFNRLHKRAKQRIQEVQKEKDDLEAQFLDVNEKSERASSQLSSLQQELERSRKHAQEALKAMDMDRQQLRSTNNKLRDNIEELRRSLAPKETALESSQQALLEKEQEYTLPHGAPT